MENNEDSLSIANLHGLLKQNRNEDFKSIISNADPSDIINMEEGELMHTAAAKNNVEIITYLYDLGFNVNAQDALKQTPLYVSVLNRNVQAAQLLLSLDADIFIADKKGMSSLQLCFRKEIEIPDIIITSVFEKLKKSGLLALTISLILEQSECSVYQVLLMKNAEVTGLMLDRSDWYIEKSSDSLLNRAMNLGYLDNLRMLLKRGYRVDERVNTFLQKILNLRSDPNKEFYLKCLIDWDVINVECVYEIAKIFRTSKEENIQILLDIGIDKYVKEKYGWALLVELFVNRELDFIKIIKNRQFDVNDIDIYGSTALHRVVVNNDKQSLVYLLNNGADPNKKNSHGETPLFQCFNARSVELLLKAGADLQVMDNHGNYIIERNLSECIISNICILEARELLNQEFIDFIKTNRNDMFNPNREELEWMKTRKISDSKSLYSVLFDDVNNAARYVRNEADAIATLKMTRERELQATYTSKLTKNLNKVLELHKLRSEAGMFFADVMKVYQHNHLVIEKIISFFTYKDLQVFREISVQ